MVSERPGEVTLEDVEASLWRLLARGRVRRESGDVDEVLGVVRRYGESVARKLRGTRVEVDEEARRAREEVDKEKRKEASARTKRCLGCGEVLAVSEFHAKASTRDGLQTRCKECSRALRRAYREGKEARDRLNMSTVSNQNGASGARGASTRLAGRFTP